MTNLDNISKICGDYMALILTVIIITMMLPFFFEEVYVYCGGLFVDGCVPLENLKITYMFLTIIIFFATIYPCFQLGENKRMLRKILEKVNHD